MLHLAGMKCIVRHEQADAHTTVRRVFERLSDLGMANCGGRFKPPGAQIERPPCLLQHVDDVLLGVVRIEGERQGELHNHHTEDRGSLPRNDHNPTCQLERDKHRRMMHRNTGDVG